MSDNKIGVEVSKKIVAFAVNLLEDVKNADQNKDGHVSANEAIGIVTARSFKLFDFLRQGGTVIREVKDIDPQEVKELIIVAVREIDNLTARQRQWVIKVSNHGFALITLGIEAPEVW